jgi:hypothetical protein
LKTLLRISVFVAALMFLSSLLSAQTAPNINYTSPQNYSVGTSIGTLAPTNSGGTVPASTVYSVSTFAGSTATSGLVDGTGTAARFNQPRGISSDAAGNLYVTEINNNGIRKITPGAVVTLFAGSNTGTSGSTNGTGTGASFFNPYDITTDPSGNFYVADYANNLIRKITPAGVVTTYATVTRPSAIIYDSFSGSFIVSRYSTNDIVKVSLAATTGVVSTFVGSGTAGNTNGTGTAASFSGPNGLTDDGNGNIYVADQANNEIRKINAAGTVTTFAGSTAGTAGSTDGTGTGALFNSPRSLVTDAAGNIYVSDANNYLLRMITPSGVVTTVAGSGVAGSADGNGTSASFNGLRGLQVDGTTGYIYLADITNNTIRKIIPSGYKITGNLPAGLSFNTNTGVISGVPTATSPATTYTITANNAYGSSTTTASIAVGPAVTTPAAICGAGTVATMTASGGSPTGGVYNWYTSATGGTLVNTGATYTPTLASTTTFYVDYTVSGSTTPRTAVTATINPKVSSPISNSSIAYSFSGDTRDVSGNKNDGILQNAPTLTTDRYGAASAAYNFNGTNQWIATTKQVTDPQTFTISAWFNTTTTTGGRIVGFSGGQDGGGQFDRHIYMNNAGQLYYGVYSSGYHTINTTASYNDGQWHHVVVTQSTVNGMKLYVDNSLLASNATYTASEPHNGYWNIGGSQISGWPSPPTSAYFSGKIDDVSIFTTELSSTVITTSSYNDLNIIGAYGPVCVGTSLTLYTPVITGATYTWTDPNGTVVASTNPAVTFPAAVAGAYNLSVTGGPGVCSSTATFTPTVNALPTATFTAPAYVDVNSNATITLSSTYDATSTYAWNFNAGTPATGTGNGPFTVKWATTGLKTVTLTVTNANGCSTIITKTLAVGAAGFSTYAFKKQLVLNTTSAGISTDQTNFPALVYIQDNNLIVANNCNNKVQYPLGNYNGANGTNYDFAFLDPTTSAELNYQVESYNSTTGTLLVWVKLPTFYANTNNTLSFYFGSLTPAHSATFYNNTWTSDYLAVYHFNESPSAGTVLDATNNAVNGVPTSITTATDPIHTATGLTGGAYSFSKASGSKIITSKNADITANAFTLSAWVSVTTPSGDNKVVSNELNFGPGYKLAVKANVVEAETRSTNTIGSEGNLGKGGTVATSWHYIQSTFNGTAFINYVDGVAATTTLLKTASNITPLAGSVVAIGIDHRSGTSDENFYDGLMDEVRISNVIKPAEWIKAEYVNQTTPLTFTDYSAGVTVNQTNAAAIPGALVYTYTGATNGNFTDATKWTNTTSGVANLAPATDGTASIIIPTGVNVNLNVDASVYGVTMNGSAGLTLQGHNLNVACNIYNQSTGRIYSGGLDASKITWNGSLAAQSYNGGTSTGYAHVGSMEVNNSAGGTITINADTLDIYHELKITKGNLVVAAGAEMILKSDATQSATLTAMPTGYTITGDISVERYLTGGTISYRGYRLLSSPVYGSTANSNNIYSINYLINSSYLTGTTGTGGGFDKTGNPTLYLYRENLAPSNVQSFTVGNFRGINTLGTAPNYGYLMDGDAGTFNIPVGNGFLFFFRGNRSATTLANATVSTYVPISATLTTKGALNTGQIIVKNWYTPTSDKLGYTLTAGNTNVRGFNLVGNPYASSIDWETFNTTTSTSGIYGVNIGTTMYTINPKTKNYATYQKGGATTNGGTRTIVSGQGFFVQASTTSPQLIFNESAKVATQSTGLNLFMSTRESMATATSFPIDQHLRLQFAKDTINTDDIYIGFKDDAKPQFVFDEDASYNTGSGAVSLASLSDDNVSLAINKLALPKKGSQIIRLKVNANTDGIYTLNMKEVKDIPQLYDIWLMDAYKKDSLDMRNNTTYAFNIIKADTNTYGANRFKLVIRQNSAFNLRLLDFRGAKIAAGVQLKWITENETNATNFTVERSTDGGKTFEVISGMPSDGTGHYAITDKSPVTGLNQYRLKQDDANGEITYSNIVNLMYAPLSNSITSGNLMLYPNPVTSAVNIAVLTTDNKVNNYSIKLFNTTGIMVKTALSSQSSWQGNVSNLLPGAYTVQVINNATQKLVGNIKFIKL